MKQIFGRRTWIWAISLAGWMLSGSLGLAAQTGSAPILGDILKKTELYYQQTTAFSASFQQKTASASSSGMITEASGRLYYQRPRQIRWEYDKPEPQVFVANHQTAWLYVPSDRQVSLYDASVFFSSPLARAFFEGATELKNYFDVSLDPKQSSKGSAVLKLVPKQDDPSVKMLYLWIDMETFRIQMLESHDLLGNTNRIALEQQKSLAQLEPVLFQLDVPPSTSIQDQEGREMAPADVEKLKQKLNARH